MEREQKRKLIGLLLSFLLVLSCFTSPVRSFFSIPVQQKISVGDTLQFKLNFPQQLLNRISLYIDKGKNTLFKVNGRVLTKPMMGIGNTGPIAAHPGTANVQLRLFGLIPIKTVNVEVLPQLKVIPGGHSIGIILHSQGVLVVGQSIVEDENGNRTNPAKDAGIEVGDVILSINGKKVSSDEMVSRAVNDAGITGSPLNIEVRHKGVRTIKTVRPVKCKETHRFRIGLYIRDSAAGVGTMTFIEPDSKKYGALGHVITDADTNQPIDIGNGKIVRSMVQGIEKGRRGRPGEKVGMFADDQKTIGKIEKNTNFGIFGSLNKDISNQIYQKAIPIALSSQVQTGPAEILTVIEGEKIEKFAIEIQRIHKQSKPDTKGLIIKVTDPRLLSKTGGIVQGMSGSPIIQGGKVVGAVTHVFVNDPTRGYGILIEWMLRETGLIKDKTKVYGSKEVTPPYFRISGL